MKENNLGYCERNRMPTETEIFFAMSKCQSVKVWRYGGRRGQFRVDSPISGRAFLLIFVDKREETVIT